MLRLHILKQSIDFYTIIKTEHHSISDGWSGPILLTSLHQYYQVLTASGRITVKEDTAYLEAQKYISNNKDTIAAYWDKTLAEVDTANDINALLSEPIDVSYKQVEQPASTSLKIEGKVYDKVKSFSRQEGITINVIVQFIWHKLLQVYSSNTRSIVGITVSGRNLPIEGIDKSVGMYINTLPLVINWDNDKTIHAQLHQIQKHISALNSHSFADLAKLQTEGQRLFHSLLIFENYPIPTNNGKDPLKISTRDYFEGVDYPLSIIANEQSGTLTIKFQYDAKHLTKDKANYHIETLNNILHQVISDSTKLHGQISLIPPKHYNQIVYDWNKTDRDYPRDKTIHQLFEEQVKKTPENVALVFEGEQLTYGELNEKSNQLARHIRAQYICKTKQALKPDTLIALCLNRSLEMVIGILGVLKAGGAYVPMDPSYPEGRVEYMLEDTRAEMVLSQRQIAQDGDVQLPKDKVVYVDLSEKLYQVENPANLKPNSSASDLVYVIYTSGTTGKPKGVMIEHLSLLNRILHMISFSKVSSSDYYLFKTNYVFDVSVSDIFTHLCKGAKLQITRYSFEISELEILLSENDFTSIHLVPSQYELLSSAIKEANIRKVYFSGEPLTTKILADVNNGGEIYNYYGPTELGEITVCRNQESTLAAGIGKVFPNCRQYVLDNNLTPVPIGVKGELYISGIGLARGYLNKQDLTAERFIFNPFATEADKQKGYIRLYKTGDLVRWLPEGNLEFIGRNDDQVKIRGYRIELGEIEHALSEIPGIKQSSVLANERQTDAGSIKYLAAYYVLDDDHQTLSQNTILDKLSKVLPVYMLPGGLMAMEAFPLTVNGKLDKRALPSPQLGFKGEDYIPPSSELEITLCNLWQDLLGLERVGITDDFFRIGGNSILAIQAASRINKISSIELSIKDLFLNSTIKLIARLIRTEMRSQKSLFSFIPQKPIGKSSMGENSYLALPLQAIRYQNYRSGNYFANNLFIRKKINNVNQTALSNAVDTLVSRHESFRTLFLEKDGKVFQKVYPQEKFTSNLSLIEICGQENVKEKIKSIIDESHKYLFDFQKEQSIKCKLIKYDENKYFFFVVMDHIICDAHSLKLIEEELFILYNSYSNGMPNQLQPLKLKLKDFVANYFSHYQGDKLAYHQSYYKRLFRDLPPKLKFESNYASSKLEEYVNDDFKRRNSHIIPKKSEGGDYRFAISKELLDQIHELASELKISFFNFILASYCVFLSRIANQNDFIVDSPMSTRHNEEYSKIIGWLTGALVTRVKVNHNTNFRDLLLSCRDDIVEAVDHIYYQSFVDDLCLEWNQLATQLNIVNDINTAEGKITDFEPYHNAREHVLFDIAFLMVVHENGIVVNCTYKNDAIDKSDISKICENFIYVLEMAISSPNVKMKDWDKLAIQL